MLLNFSPINWRLTLLDNPLRFLLRPFLPYSTNDLPYCSAILNAKLAGYIQPLFNNLLMVYFVRFDRCNEDWPHGYRPSMQSKERERIL